MKERLDAAVQKLEQERDELKLKMHLAKADARDEWEEMEERWGRLRQKLSQVKEGASEASEDVRDAASGLAEEIRKGYRKIVDLL